MSACIAIRNLWSHLLACGYAHLHKKIRNLRIFACIEQKLSKLKTILSK